MLDRSPDIVRRLCRAPPAGAPGDGDASDAPDRVAELIEALSESGLGRDDVLRQGPAIFAALWAQILGGDPSAPRRAEAFARTAAIFIRMPDPFGPADGAPHDDLDAGPQTFDETNALLEELALRLGEWDAERAQGVPGAPVAPLEGADR